MSNLRSIATQPKVTLAEGLRAIAAALDAGELKEPPYALLVFGISADDDPMNIVPLGQRLPGDIEMVGMLTVAASAVGFGEQGEPMPVPVP